MSGKVGMDVDQVRSMGRKMQAQADHISGTVVPTIDRLVRSAASTWTTPKGRQFVQWWQGQHRGRLLRVAEDLRGLGRSAIANADEQDGASRSGAAPSITPPAGSRFGDGTGGAAFVPIGGPRVPLDSETREVELGATAFGVVGQQRRGEATLTRMADGTYEVTIRGEDQASLSIGIQELLGSAGVSFDGFDAGLGVHGAGGAEWAFVADDEASARRLFDLLSGRSLDASILDDPRVRIDNATVGALVSVDGGGELGPWGAGVEAGTWTERTHHADGTVTSRTVVDEELGGSGWNADVLRVQYVQEITTDRHGNVIAAVVERSTTTLADTRGGGEKAGDAFLGLVPIIDGGRQEQDVVMEVVRHAYSGDAMPAAVLEAARAGDHRLLRAADVQDPTGAFETVLRYGGRVDGSSVGVGVGVVSANLSGSNQGLAFRDGTYREPGGVNQTIVDPAAQGLVSNVIRHPDGSVETVWMSTF